MGGSLGAFTAIYQKIIHLSGHVYQSTSHLALRFVANIAHLHVKCFGTPQAWGSACDVPGSSQMLHAFFPFAPAIGSLFWGLECWIFQTQSIWWLVADHENGRTTSSTGPPSLGQDSAIRAMKGTICRCLPFPPCKRRLSYLSTFHANE